jgi:putative IMPACT (imprinted ancient) family translation regulator
VIPPERADDPEAGTAILRMRERAECRVHLVIVTRRFGGVKPGGDRFRNVQAAVRAYLAEIAGAG